MVAPNSLQFWSTLKMVSSARPCGADSALTSKAYLLLMPEGRTVMINMALLAIHSTANNPLVV